MAKIVIHPGIGKTATSAIQHVFYDFLPSTNQRDGFCYSPYGLIGNVHNIFANNHPQFSQAKFELALGELVAFSKSYEGDILISSEFLIRCNKQHISVLLKTLLKAGNDICVILAIRNYSDYLISAFLQAVKVKWGMKNNEGILSYCERELNNINLPKLIGNWSDVIGDENIFILDYDENKKEILSKFAGFFNVTLPQKSDVKINQSISLPTANILLEFDKYCHDNRKRIDLIRFLGECGFQNTLPTIIRENVLKSVGEQYVKDKDILKQKYRFI